MVKHAGCVPQCAIAFEKLWLEAGAPAGAYTNLFISYDQVNRVIDDPRIKGVALTGSVEAGKIVAGRAGLNLKKSTMELGGNDAFIVLDDADLDKTVSGGLGQDEQRGSVLCRGEAHHRRGRAGRPLSRQVPESAGGAQARRPYGRGDDAWPPLTEAALVKRRYQVNRAVGNGASVVMGGKRINRPGAFMSANYLSGYQARQSRL